MIRLDYLKNLNDRYNQWAENYKGNILIIDVDKLNFSENKDDLGVIIDKVNAKLFGLFNNNEEEKTAVKQKRK